MEDKVVEQKDLAKLDFHYALEKVIQSPEICFFILKQLSGIVVRIKQLLQYFANVKHTLNVSFPSPSEAKTQMLAAEASQRFLFYICVMEEGYVDFINDKIQSGHCNIC